MVLRTGKVCRVQTEPYSKDFERSAFWNELQIKKWFQKSRISINDHRNSIRQPDANASQMLPIAFFGCSGERSLRAAAFSSNDDAAKKSLSKICWLKIIAISCKRGELRDNLAEVKILKSVFSMSNLFLKSFHWKRHLMLVNSDDVNQRSRWSEMFRIWTLDCSLRNNLVNLQSDFPGP